MVIDIDKVVNNLDPYKDQDPNFTKLMCYIYGKLEGGDYNDVKEVVDIIGHFVPADYEPED